MGPAARPARPDELGLLGELLAQALADLPERRGGSLLAPVLLGGESLASRIDRVARAGDACLLAGTLDDRLVGLAGARTADRAIAGADLAVVDLLYVAPSARRAGVARCLFTALRTWAIDMGCEGLDVPALPGDRPLKAFLESVGLRARLLVLSTDLEGPSSS